MMKKVIDQKEYLKKYMSFDNSDKKKKKKKYKTGAKTVKIIDDDIDLKNVRPIEENEFEILLDGEDAPQIAGIIDERGPVDFMDKKRWKIITENEEGDLTIINRPIDEEKKQNDKTNTNQFEIDNLDLNQSKSKYSKSKHINSSSQRKNYDSDLSPSRQFRNDDSDLSPSRYSKNNDSDLSPPRQSKNDDSDLHPSRKKMKYHRSSIHSTSERNYRSSGNRENDSDLDLNPPRKREQNVDVDLYENKRKDRKDKESYSGHISRHKEQRSGRDNSHRSDRGHDYSHNSSRQNASKSSRDKRERDYDDCKPRSYSDMRERRKKSRWDEDTDDSERRHTENHSRDRDNRMTKTLDGKTAGLQDAKALREETKAHKQREVEQFNKLNKAVSGVGQVPIVRDKMGRKRNLETEAAEEREREIRQREIDEKYAKWGKGLKQVEDHEEKLKNDLYEMSKPLARYADDADLDKQLREQERDGDPMLQYIKQKQIKEGKRKPDPPQYQGSFSPNRFGIKPGHRWDGVDRSNGYEKKWFEAQSSKVARQEEAYKWSTADM